MIKLYGALAKKYPKLNDIRVHSAGEAIRAMEANFPGFRNSIKRDAKYLVVRGDSLKKGKALTEDEVSMEFSDKNWHICPVPAGAGGKGLIPVILGVVLIAAAVVLSGIPGAQTLSPFLFKAGIGLVLYGLSSMLAPTPPTYDYTDRAAEEKPSYLFDGPVNTLESGLTIPLVYGESFVGSIVVSGGLEIVDV